MAGLYFEEFVIGQRFTHEIRRTVTEMDNMLFSSMTYNPAPIHIDHAYAATTEFGKPLVNSLFTLGLVIGLSVQDTTFGTTMLQLQAYLGRWKQTDASRPVGSPLVWKPRADVQYSPDVEVLTPYEGIKSTV